MKGFGMEVVETDCEYKCSLMGTWTCENTSTLTKQVNDFTGGKKKFKKWLFQFSSGINFTHIFFTWLSWELKTMNRDEKKTDLSSSVPIKISVSYRLHSYTLVTVIMIWVA